MRHYEHVERSYFKVETYAYRGPAIYDGKGYRRLDVEDDEDRVLQGDTITERLDRGASASLRRCRSAARIDETYEYQLSLNARNDFTLSYRGPTKIVPAGGTHTFNGDSCSSVRSCRNNLKTTATEARARSRTTAS